MVSLLDWLHALLWDEQCPAFEITRNTRAM